MKICICCSLSFTKEVLELTDKLEAAGYNVLLPNGVINKLYEKNGFDPIKAKIETNAIKAHIKKIKECDVVLVCNYTKNNIINYIGANTFLEIAFAHYYNKPIFALNPLPDQPYIYDEIMSFDIKVLDNDIAKLDKK